MAAISKATHYKLLSDIKLFLSTLPASIEGKNNLQENILQMEQLYDNYAVNLSNLHQLISKYAALERLVKVELRRQQLKKTKQKMQLIL